jgi:pimeloyl-ACP methyl ester carboxylesterase
MAAKDAAFEGRYAEVNGMRLHYVSKGQGKLLMFVHGFPEFWYEWKNQLEEFGRDYQAVAPDMRGYNLSSKPEGLDAYTTEPLVEDLRALAEHLGHRKFILIAHDWGGAVAWNFASRHPDWLEKLIIINAPHMGVFARELAQNPVQQESSQYMLFFRSPEAEKGLSANNYAGLWQALTSGDIPTAFTDEDRERYIEAWSQPGALTGGLNYYRAAALAPPKLGEEAAGVVQAGAASKESLMINVPTLVIWGEKDTALRTGNLEGLDEYVPDLTIARIPDGSHWVVHEQPERVNALIREFII